MSLTILVEAILLQRQRNKLPGRDFAARVNGVGKLPINDRKHVKAAFGRLNQTQGLSPAQRSTAARKIAAKARTFGMDTSNFRRANVRQNNN